MKILLAVPVHKTVHYTLVPWIVKMCRDARYGSVDLTISSMVGNEANRGAITEYFLEGNWDFLLMIDSDQEPLQNPLDMLLYDKDVIGMPTKTDLDEGFVWNVYDKIDDEEYRVNPRKERGRDIERVYAIGTGCILIKRQVLEIIKHPFVPIRDENDKRLVSQDIVFSKKCRDAGFKVWVDWSRITRHFKEVDLITL